MTTEPLEPTSEYQSPRSIQPETPVRRSWHDRLPGWWQRAAIGVLVAALALTAFGAYRLSNDLTAAQDTVANQSDQLARTEATLDAATARGDDLSSQVGSLQAQVQQQRDCVSALRDAVATADLIHALQVKAYNLSAKGSAWAKANKARNTAMIAVVHDYYQAYSAAWDNLYATANGWVSRGNAKARIASDKLAIMNAEIAKMDRLIDQVQGMLASSGGGVGVCDATGSSL